MPSTLFELATQNGHVSRLLGLNKTMYSQEIVVTGEHGEREYRVYRAGSDTPCLKYPIPDRDRTMSQQAWREMVERDLTALWASVSR